MKNLTDEELIERYYDICDYSTSNDADARKEHSRIVQEIVNRFCIMAGLKGDDYVESNEERR